MMTMTNWNNIVRRISDCAQYLCFIKKILDITTLGQRCLIIIRLFFFSTKPISTPHNCRLETILFDSCFSTLTDNRGCTSPSHSRSTTVHEHNRPRRDTDHEPSTGWPLDFDFSHRSPTTVYDATLIKSHLQDDRSTSTSHSRSTHQAFLQQEHLSQAVCRPTCHWRLDTRWPRSEGGCGLSLTHHAPHKSSHSRSPHLPSLFIAGAQRFKYFHSSLDSRWLSSEGGGRLSMTPPHTSQHLCISPPTLSHTPRAWYYRQLRYLDITRRLQHSKQSDKL